MTGYRHIAYAAFDAYPGLKGAQAHIRMNLRALARMAPRVSLLCLGQGEEFRDPETSARVVPFLTDERNFLRRSELFGQFLTRVADGMVADPPDVLHFRDVWSGVPLLSHSISRRCRTIFEVNGLPSVELQSHFPRFAANAPLLARLRRMEEECLAVADRVITISSRTAAYLRRRGCPGDKIRIIPNAADLHGGYPDSTGIPDYDRILASGRKVILYTGTLARWQGIDTLLAACSHLNHREDHHLVIAASSPKGLDRVSRLVAGHGLCDRTTIFTGTDMHVVPRMVGTAWFSAAPLARGARNEIQGCCPVKIVESLAAGTPVVASDLPVVRELIHHGREGLLAPPGSSRGFAAAMEQLLDDHHLRARLSRNAAERARRDFGAELFAERLQDAYRGNGGGTVETVGD